MDALGMIVTGVLPLIVIGAGLAALFAARDQRASATRLWASIAGAALLVSIWVLLFAFRPPS